MVFDEVDSGIGGAVAEIVGRELRALGQSGQVLCVTHLPQVASQGHHHLRVAKSTDGRTTRTALTELAPQDRVEEIARMLGGIEVTGKAREHAREMLRTHVDLPPDPSPSDKMPALTAKDLLAQAKIAARSGKEARVEPKDLGVDPRATAAEPSKTAAAVTAKPPGKAPAQPVKAAPQAGEGTPQPGKTAAQTANKAPPQAGEGAPQPSTAAAQSAEATPQAAAGASQQPSRAAVQPVKAAPEPVKDTPQGTKAASPAAKGSREDNVIDLATKAAARPGAKRR
jgi:hypothetical protein